MTVKIPLKTEKEIPVKTVDTPTEDLIYVPLADMVKKKFEYYLNLEPDSLLVTIFTIGKVLPSIDGLNYTGEEIHSRSAAEKKAKRIFEPVYSRARDYVNPYSSQNLGQEVAEKLFAQVKNEVIEITDVINNLDQNIQKKHTFLIKQTLELLDLDNLEHRIFNLAKRCLEDQGSWFADSSDYLHKVDYTETYNTDAPYFLHKKDWFVNVTPAAFDLTDDLQNSVERYCKSLSFAFVNKIIKPMIDLIIRIKE